jgi:hypothetical protein
MVTSDEIAHVPLVASLSAADRERLSQALAIERLSQACADIRLAAGEMAIAFVHQYLRNEQ